MIFITNIFLFISYKGEVMKNYILIISILTIIAIFIIIYPGDYIKGIYFHNSIEDFRDAYDIISNSYNKNKSSHENFENKDELTIKYEERLKLRKENNYNISGSPTLLEVSLNAEADKYKNGAYDKYSTINDPISDVYLPYTIKNYRDDPVAISNNNMNEFTIINIYKNTLDRQPTEQELSKHLQDFYENDMNEDILKLRIYNSTEFKIITNMQSNDIKPELITNISKGQLKDKLKQLYKDQHNTIIVNTKLLDILVKCYIHLQFNDYLFKAMLMHDNYMVFENKLRNVYILTDEKLLEIFNESFILHELRLIANELKRQDIIKRTALATPVSLHKNELSELNSSNIINIGADKHISDIVKNSDNVFNINIMVNDKLSEANINTSTPYARTSTDVPPIYQSNNQRTPITQLYDQPNSSLQNPNDGAFGYLGYLGAGGSSGNNTLINNIANIAGSANIGNNSPNISNNSNIINNSSSLLNILNNSANNTLNNAMGLANTANIANTTTSSSGIPGIPGIPGLPGLSTRITEGTDPLSPKPKYNDIYNNLQNELKADTQYSTNNDSKQQEMTMSPERIYDPIDYKQHYRGDMRYRPNVCSYGTKQLVQPTFLNSSTLFQGTDLKEAAENTQVGSIMPKFEYREYEDVR